jgi:hypothetical protein
MVTLSTLMYEIGLTRIFSVTTFYHFAFVAISVALFGLTVGALLVFLLPDRFTDANVKRQLWLFSLLFALAVAVCFAIQLTIRFEPRATLGGIASVVGTCVIASIPFVLSGVVVCLALTKFPSRVNRLYAADLIGAGLGCVLLAVLLGRLDGPSAMILVGALAAVGSLCFALDAGGRRALAAAAVVVVVLAGFAGVNAVMASDGDAPISIVWTKEQRDPPHVEEAWNSFSRVTIDGDPNTPSAPFGWGFSSTMPADTRVRQLDVGIDSVAGTELTRYRGDQHDTDFLRYDITNLVHYVRPNRDGLVVGVGGGRDVLSALEFRQHSVTGVEINGEILRLLNDRFGDFTGHLDRIRKVKFVNDEARSYLSRTDRRYGIIQISLIDTFAATSAGAFALSENSLYTTQAWSTFFDRLQPDGILSVSRWYQIGNRTPLETYRTVALAAQALTERGVARPRDHILVYRSPTSLFAGTSVATVLVSPKAFTSADIARVDDAATRLEFTPVLTPDRAINSRFAGLAAPGGPGNAVDKFDEDISPPTDNRPFFFQMADLESLIQGRDLGDRRVTQPVLVLGLLALTVFLLTLMCIVVPLLLTTKRTSHRGMRPFYVYFAAIGLGFLLVEFSQLLRLSVYLGHPIYALTVVLFSVLLFSGIGSMLSERIARPDRRNSMLLPLGALLVALVIFGALTPTVIDATRDATTPIRIAIAVLLLAPIALTMGMPLAIGMRAASTREGAPTAFLWGINGAMSVLASVAAMTIALFFGIAVAFWIGWGAYAVAAGSLALILGVRIRSAPASDTRRRSEAKALASERTPAAHVIG